MDTSMPLVGRSRAIWTVCVVMMCLSILAVLLRVFVRSYIVRAFGWDDTLMVAAAVGLLWSTYDNEGIILTVSRHYSRF